jgi:hypothetical protein
MNINRIFFYNNSRLFPESALNFYKNMSNEEIIYHLYSDYDMNTTERKKNLIQNNWKKNKAQLDNSIMEWTPGLRLKIFAALSIFKTCCDKDLFSMLMSLGLDIYIVCSKKNLEFGYPHTNSNFIFLPHTLLTEATATRVARVLLHELVHIYQRFCPDKSLVKKYCARLGYKFIGHIPTNKFKNHVVIRNPDTYEHGTYFYIYNNKIYYFLLYYNQDNYHIDTKTYLFERNNWVEVDFIPSTFPGVRQYEHPFEVMACHWSNQFFRGPAKKVDAKHF